MRGLTKANQGRKSETTFCQNKFKLRKVISQQHHMNGLLKLPISSIKWYKGNPIIDWVSTDLKKLKTILGLEIFHGKTYMRERSGHLLSHHWKIISIKRIYKRNGKIWMILNSRKTFRA